MGRPEAGIFPGISRVEYESIDAINQSLLKRVLIDSPAHARYEQLHPADPTPAKILGDAIHQAVLEPARFEREYAAPAMDDEGRRYDKRTKEGKAKWAAWESENAGKTMIDSASDWKAIQRVKRELWARPVTRSILGGPGHIEIAIVWEDPKTGLWCKALVDRIQRRDHLTYLWDLKSCASASPIRFPRQAADLKYHFQAAFYLWGASIVRPAPDRRFGFLAVEKEEPWAMKPWECKPSVIEQGQLEVRAALDIWARCVERDEWPAYGDEIEEFHLPEWAYREVAA